MQKYLEMLNTAKFVKESLSDPISVEIQNGYIAGMESIVNGKFNSENVSAEICKAKKAAHSHNHWLKGYLVALNQLL